MMVSTFGARCVRCNVELRLGLLRNAMLSVPTSVWTLMFIGALKISLQILEHVGLVRLKELKTLLLLPLMINR